MRGCAPFVHSFIVDEWETTNYNLAGNGLSTVYHYDALGRLNGGWVCDSSNSASCSGGAQIYGFTNAWSQNQLNCSSDTALNQGSTYGYDEFNRLASRTVNSGTVQNYTWQYDRYGNRWQQNFTGGTGYGNSQSLTFNTANNQVNVSGFSYDAAGNMTNDSNHGYTFDAEGNIIAVDAGETATYVYNALNQRVQAVVSGTTTGYVFNAAGQRVSEWNWNGTTYAQLKGKYYLGGTPVGYYTTASSGAGAATHFEHQDWLGTERLRTTYNGSVEGSFTSLPFGDGPATTGADTDASHYATLDHDTESDTDHAQFRQYANQQGRFLSPDPYGGSYDGGNPQSFNRYVYALNNPLGNRDPSGLDEGCEDGTYNCFFPGPIGHGDISGGGGGGDIYNLMANGVLIGPNGVEEAPTLDPDGSGEIGWTNPNNGAWIDAAAGEEIGLIVPYSGPIGAVGSPAPSISGPIGNGLGSGGSGSSASNIQSRLTCSGTAYVLAGNPANIGQTGFPGVTVTNGSAAVIPLQFTGVRTGGPFMRSIGASTFGVVFGPTGGSEAFATITQAVGNQALGTAVQAQDIIMGRDPGALVIEIVGGTNTWKDASVTINMPDLGQGCPAGTQ